MPKITNFLVDDLMDMARTRLVIRGLLDKRKGKFFLMMLTCIEQDKEFHYQVYFFEYFPSFHGTPVKLFHFSYNANKCIKLIESLRENGEIINMSTTQGLPFSWFTTNEEIIVVEGVSKGRAEWDDDTEEIINSLARPDMLMFFSAFVGAFGQKFSSGIGGGEQWADDPIALAVFRRLDGFITARLKEWESPLGVHFPF